MAKFRLSFVTNSSSSSFICSVCGTVEAGMDMSMSEAGMYECVNGHTFCEDHIMGEINKLEVCEELIKSRIEDYKTSSYYKNNLREQAEDIAAEEEILVSLKEMDEDGLDDLMSDYEFRYNTPKKFCPICNLSSIPDDIFIQYLLKKFESNESAVKDEIVKRFGTIDDLKVYVSK
jgi:hypothetical protein